MPSSVTKSVNRGRQPEVNDDSLFSIISEMTTEIMSDKCYRINLHNTTIMFSANPLFSYSSKSNKISLVRMACVSPRTASLVLSSTMFTGGGAILEESQTYLLTHTVHLPTDVHLLTL